MGFLNKILESVDEKKKGLRKNIKESHDMTLELITQDWFESKYLESQPNPLPLLQKLNSPTACILQFVGSRFFSIALLIHTIRLNNKVGSFMHAKA